jgi:hypothetical protein
MKSKLLLVVGVAVGYILGARAGRDRYEALVARADGLWRDPRVARARREAARYTRAQAPVIRARAETVAKAVPGVISDGARATATAAKEVADRTTKLARDVTDKTVTATRDLTDKTVTATRDLTDKTVTAAKGAADKTVTAAADAATRVGEARDTALADLDDEDDTH